jgi:hypothetical protein
MPDEEIAASSTAETPEAPETPPEPQEPASQEPEGQGIFDEEKTAPAEEAKPSEESAPSEPESEKSDESVSSSEDAEPPVEEKTGSKAERRIKQLTAQLKTLERQMEEKFNQPPPRQAIKEPVKPKLDDFETVEAYDSALEKWKVEDRQYAIEQDRIQQKQKRVQEEQEKAAKQARETWDKNATRILKVNPEFTNVEEFTKKALNVVQPNATTDGFLVDSPVGPEILNYLYENPEDAETIRNLQPYKAFRELVKLENKLSDQAKGIKKPVPRPPATVRGQAAAPSAPKTAADVLYGS